MLLAVLGPRVATFAVAKRVFDGVVVEDVLRLCNEHKEAQKPLQATKHLKETSKITSIISTSFSIKQQPHRIGSNDAACAMSTEWLEATAGKRPAISSQQAKSDKQQR